MLANRKYIDTLDDVATFTLYSSRAWAKMEIEKGVYAVTTGLD